MLNLGFPWTLKDVLLPGWLESDKKNQITGLSYPFIFDKFLMDKQQGEWMSKYSAVIRSSAAKISSQLNTSNTQFWMDKFMESQGGRIAQYITQNATSKTQNILLWFPKQTKRSIKSKNYSRRSIHWAANPTHDSNEQMDYVILHTTTNFSRGTSLSHLDSIYYEGTLEFLMRPYATSGVGAEAFIPQGKYGALSKSTLSILKSMGYLI